MAFPLDEVTVKSEKEKMIASLVYHPYDPELCSDRQIARTKSDAFNNLPASATDAERLACARDLLGIRLRITVPVVTYVQSSTHAT